MTRLQDLAAARRPGPEGSGVLKLTLRNLLARKVRLVISGLAIVFGVAFLSGVLVFGNGLSSTFRRDHLQLDARRRPPRRADGVLSRPALPRPPPALSPELVHELGTSAGGTRRWRHRRHRDEPARLRRHPRRRHRRTDARLQPHRHPNMAGDPLMVLRAVAGRRPRRDRPRQAAADNGDYELGDEVQLLAPFGESERTATWSAPPSSTAAARRAPPCWSSAPRAHRTSSWRGRTRSTRSRSPRPTGSRRPS